jgi:hypothetical protein
MGLNKKPSGRKVSVSGENSFHYRYTTRAVPFKRSVNVLAAVVEQNWIS